MTFALGKTALVVGGNRGLGLAVVNALSSRGLTVYATVRGAPPTDSPFPSSVKVIPNVDLASDGGGADALQEGLKDAPKLDLVFLSAGVLRSDTLETLSWADHLEMYKTCTLAPAFLSSRLATTHAFADPAKLFVITTEGGSIALRTKEEGGGNYGHHGSKAAANMMGRLLSIDLGEGEGRNVTVVNIHPGFMKTEMTRAVGFDSAYESGGAVEPSEAAESLVDFAAKVTPEFNGRFFAPRGPRDVGQAENVLGKNLPTPLELPW